MIDEAADSNDIAIIGLAGRFPGAPDAGALWRNLRDGVESISRFAPEELESSVLLPPRLREHPDFVPAGAVLAGVDLFDHEFFGTSLREARWTDPQQRVFLELAWAALEDAGYAAGQVGDRASVYAGASANDYLLALLGEIGDDPAAQYEALIAGTSVNLATRVSFQLGLRGESVTIHTACSTGLAAVHLACQSLLAGQSRLALAGSVRIVVEQRTGYVYQDGMILSRDGHCRAFDHRASGTVAGNGAGVVVLKPLEYALADGDHVYAVIKGVALNNDGQRGVGYTAPSVAGQAEVIAEALSFAGVSAADIDYVEAHGTGTPLGDPIEVAALTRAFRRTTDRVGDCSIGSVKSNVGHLDTAAGIVGLIKVVLMLQHGEIPPSLHVERPNPAIDFANSPFVVSTELRPWPRHPGRPRRAGVSSFGIGGTNVHAVLEQAPPPAPSSDSPRPYQLVTLSARTQPALTRMAHELADRLPADGSLADIAYTRAVGRAAFGHRRCQVVSTAAELQVALCGRRPDNPAVLGEPRVAFLFPGQGAAWHGMAAELYQAEAAFRAALEPCLAAAEQHLGQPLLPVLCEGEGPIADPPLAHAALFTVEVALARLWQDWGVSPAALVGHSFGEYAAACVAGVLSVSDAAALAITRGELVARLPAGSALAVGLGEEQLTDWLDDDLTLAAVNGHARCLVSGPVESVARLHERLTAAKLPAVPLPVNYAFHSPAVEPVLAELAAAAAAFPHRAATLPWLSSLTGDWWAAEGSVGAYWSAQMREPVRFADALDRLADASSPAEPLVLVEVGPDQALSALARDHLGARAVVAPSMPSHRATGSAHRVLLAGLGTLWCAGVPVDWQSFYRAERRRRVPLPAYPFEPTPVGSPSASVDALATVAAISNPPGDGSRRGPAPQATRGDGPRDGAPLTRENGPRDEAPPAREDGPRDEVERQVFDIWRERLGTDTFGVHDSFLELGGNSLTAAQLLTRLREVFAAPIPLSALFDAPTVAGMADRIRAMTGDGATGNGAPVARAEAGGAHGLPPIRPVPRASALGDTPSPGSAAPRPREGDTAPRPKEGDSVPLSAVQERTLTLEAADPGNPALLMSVAVAIDGDLDRAVLERAVRAVADRHETMHTTFHLDRGRGWTARIAPAAAVTLECEEVAGGEEEAQRIARADLTRPVDLTVSPLRARLLRLASAPEHVLLLTVHHVVCDTLSLVILVREIAACYRAFDMGETVPLPPLAVQYADFAAWQRQSLGSGALDRQRTYWRDRLADPPPPLALPTDHTGPKPAGQQPARGGAQLDVGLPADLAGQVVEFSRRAGVTPFVTMLAAYVALLGRVTGADDLVVGTPVGNRDRPELEPLVGYVAHALPLRADLRGDPRFVTLVRQLQQTMLAAYTHPDVPYEALATVGAGRLFDAVFILHADLPHEERLPGATWRLWPVPDAPATFGAALAAVTLMLGESQDGFTGTLSYPDELFDAATATRLFDQFRTLLAGAIRSPETRVSCLRFDQAPPIPAQPDEPGGHRFHITEPGLELPRWVPPSQRRHRSMQISLSYFANDEDDLTGPKYQLLLEGVRLADRRGFAAVWTPERHFHSFGGLYPSPAVTSAALAAATTRIGIRAGSVVLPLHNPIRVAEDWAVIDNLSGGRVGVSFASGWHPDDFVLAPNQFPQRRELLRAGIEEVRALWRGESVRRSNGVGTEVEVTIRPRPVQAELPFWLTAAGSPDTFRLAGELGAAVLTNLLAQSLDDLGAKIALYRQAWREAGHDGEGHVTLMLHAFLADDAESAYATARGPLLRYFRSSVDIARGFAAAQGMTVRPEDLSEADIQTLLEHGLERYVRGGGLFGTPQTCMEMVERVRRLGVDEVAALVDYGTPVEDTLHSIRLLGQLVEQEAKRARAAAQATATDTTARARELARAIAARGADTVSGPADALAWLAETAPDVLAGRTVLVTDVDPPAAVLRALHAAGVQAFVPAPELPDGSLPARWAVWCDDSSRVIAPAPGATVLDAAGNPLGIGVVGELALSGTPTGQRARWRPDGRLDLLPGPVVRAAPAPLSPAQRAIWSIDQLMPGNIAYNNAVALRMSGPLDPKALHRALREVVHRHEVLRTTFHAGEDGQPVQVVHPSVEVDLPVRDAAPDELDELARAHARESFVLDRGPLLRARLLRLADTEHVLLISMHHIVSDGWSAGVLFGELGGLYAALVQDRPSPLPPLPMQYADYAAAQRERPDDPVGLEYWMRTLAGLPLLELPTDRPRPAVLGQHGGRAPVHIERSTVDALAGLCRATGTTPFMVLYAALVTLLGRHSGQTDVAIGTAVAGRTTPETEVLVGVFINTVVIRADLTGDPTFTELLGRVRVAVLDALAHSEVPFERLVDAMKVPRDLSHAPLCQALLVLHNTPMPRLELGGLTLEGLDVDPGTAKLDLTMELREGPDGIRGFIEYNSDLFDRPTVDRLAQELATLLADGVAAPRRRLSELAPRPAVASGSGVSPTGPGSGVSPTGSGSGVSRNGRGA